MPQASVEEHVCRINAGDVFFFLCHRDIDCFTRCCRNLELVLTPYDVLRLRRATGLTSGRLHERYIIEEHGPGETFPSFFLTMVDDGRASCVFVTNAGCSIYQHRPGACRTYPLGRGATRTADGIDEQFVLLREPHCQGISEKTVQTVHSFMRSQDLQTYNRFNDMLTGITQHRKIREGYRPTAAQIEFFKLALYDLDTFRSRLKDGGSDFPAEVDRRVFEDDEMLLEYGMKLIDKLFFRSQ